MSHITETPRVVHMMDSCSHPSASTLAKARRAGVRFWGGYLDAPAASCPWPSSALELVMNEAIGLVPIYVAPLTDADRREHPAHKAAVDALAQVAGLGGHVHEGHRTICLDVEQRAYESGPASCLDWVEEFVRLIRHGGMVPTEYANPAALIAQHRRGHDARPSAAWVASWIGTKPPASLAHITSFPDELWHHEHQRAWQWYGQATFDGIGVDLSVVEHDFPAMHRPGKKPPVPAPAPKPKPHDLLVSHHGQAVHIADGEHHGGDLLVQRVGHPHDTRVMQGPITIEAKGTK